jgi:predicted ATPase
MIRNIRVEGFKSIASQAVDLGRVNCFIGANGVGKSNLLEAIGILGAAASGSVDDEAIVRRGVRAGLPRLYKTAFKDERIRPHITLEATGEAGSTYRVSLLNPLENPNPAWSFKTESLADDSGGFVSRGVRGDKENLLETAGLAALKLVEMPADGAATRLLQTLQDYAIYCPNTPSLRGTVQDGQMRPPVGLSGGRLAEGFQDLRKIRGLNDDHLDSVFELIDWASDIGATEEARSLLSPSVPRSKNVLLFTDRFMEAGRNALTAYDASEGALYVLFSAVLCLSPSSPRLFAVDNLDQALNPRLMARLASRLAGWLKAASSSRQLLFTAHNPAVLDGLDLADDEVRLFAVERNSDGHSCVRRVTLSDDLLKLNKEYPLSRLWMMGHLEAACVAADGGANSETAS